MLHRFLIDYHFYAICLVLGIAVGAYKVLVHGHHGRGVGIILSTFAIMIAGLYVMRDPIGDLYSDDGLINQGRTLGFTAAQAAFNNGPIAGGAPAVAVRSSVCSSTRSCGPRCKSGLRHHGRQHRHLWPSLVPRDTNRST